MASDKSFPALIQCLGYLLALNYLKNNIAAEGCGSDICKKTPNAGVPGPVITYVCNL